MTLTNRDKALALVLPALVIALGYAMYGVGYWRTKIKASTQSLKATRERIPSHAEEHKRRDKLALSTRESRAETESITKLNLELKTTAAAIETDKQELEAARRRAAGPEHREALAKIDSDHRSDSKLQADAHDLILKELQARHEAALAALWRTSQGPTADRTRRTELLNKVLSRFDLTIMEETDEDKGNASPPRLQVVMKAASESMGLAPPRVRHIKLKGKYSEVAGALDSLARGDAWAVPLALTMKPAMDGSALEWTLTVWV